MKTYLSFFIIFHCIPSYLFSQNIQYVALKVDSPNGGVEIGLFDPNDCSDSLIAETQYSFFTDITFDPLGDTYIFIPFSSTNPSIQPSVMKVNYFPWNDFYLSAFGLDYLTIDVTALTCTNLGKIYAAGIGLWDVTVGYSQSTYLGDFPPSMQAAGDLTYREGKLYMSTISNSLVEVNIDDPANSTVAFDFPPGTPEIHGLATVEIDCDSFITYATGINATGSIIYEVDFDNETLIEVCQSDRFIVGLASMDECHIPQCDVTLDLDANDDSGAFGNDVTIGKVCVLPVNIADDDISIYSELDHVDSIHLKILNPNYIYQSLNLADANNISIIGGGTPNLTLVNNGTATIVDFENAMTEILYNSTAPTLSSNSVNIEVISYSFDVESPPALSTILFGNSEVSLNISIDSITCFGNNDGQLNVIPDGGTEPYSFLWNNNLDTDSISNLSEGQYQITVTDKYGCSATENNIVLSQPDSLNVSIINDGDLVVCENGGQLSVVGDGGTISYDFLWSNGSTSNFNYGINPGIYSVTLTDQNGCEAFDSFILEEGFPNFLNDSISLCEGETFELFNLEFTSDTTFCQMVVFSNGCDYTHCYELSFTEIITTNFTEKICPGDNFLWNGELLDEDTIVVNTYISSSGCDSIVSLSLELFDVNPINFMTTGSLCDGGQVEISTNPFDTYLWSTGEIIPIIEVGEENIFWVTVTDSNNCELIDEIEVEIEELEINYSITPPTCYNYKDAEIQINNVEGGTEPYLFSLNGSSMQQSFLFNDLESGNYNLVVEDVNGCQKELTINIDQLIEPTLEIQNYHKIDLGDSLELQLITNISQPNIVWQPSTYLNCDTCLSVVSNPFQSIIYEIVASDINGCLSKKAIEIEVDRTLDVFIPNAFSPNDDGFNDLFTIFSGASISKINYLKIFDRWGELVFEEENLLPNTSSTGWDGRFKNKKMLDGVYVYVVEVERIDGSTQSLSGELSLIR